MTDARVTQEALEHWFAANADARATQVALEHWHSTSSSGLHAVVTQVALEHWYSVAAPTTAQARAWILA